MVTVTIDEESLYLLDLSILVSYGRMFLRVTVNRCQPIVEYMFQIVLGWYVESTAAVWMHTCNVVSLGCV